MKDLYEIYIFVMRNIPGLHGGEKIKIYFAQVRQAINLLLVKHKNYLTHFRNLRQIWRRFINLRQIWRRFTFVAQNFRTDWLSAKIEAINRFSCIYYMPLHIGIFSFRRFLDFLLSFCHQSIKTTQKPSKF